MAIWGYSFMWDINDCPAFLFAKSKFCGYLDGESIKMNRKDDVGTQALEAYIAGQFGDKGRFRISRRKYPAGERSAGITVSSLCFVVQGACKYVFDGATFDLAVGDRCELPAGDFTIENVGDGVCEVVLVLRIPSSVEVRS